MGLATGTETKKLQTSGAQSSEHTHGRKTHDHSPTHHEQTRALPEGRPAQGHEYLPILAGATTDAVRDWNVKTGQLSWPQGLRLLLGYDEADSLEIGFWQQRVHPADRTRISMSIADAFAKGAETWSGEYRFRRADGEYMQLLERAGIVRDSLGGAVRFVGVLMDISERKHLQDQLCRSQKMEAFGQLAAGVAHDFNNYLTTILGYSDLVLCEADAKTDIASHVAEIRAAAGRASTLAGQLLAFSRKQALEPCVIEVNSLVQNMERSLLRLLGDHITVVCHLHHEKGGVHLKVDPGQLTQIILNLAVNARDAMRAGGQLTLETAVATLERDDAPDQGFDAAAPGEYVVIRIIDTGIGMTEDVKEHLFEPFFTTKNEGLGSGLGLATSYGIVRQSGGQIFIESELGSGTRVEIYLPRVPAPPPPPYRKPAARKLPKGTESILVLEDDSSVRHMSMRILRRLGYDVLEAASGDDAQRIFAGEAGKNRKIHLVLTDMVMPQMSGRSFADWLHKVSPETRVMFVSGYLEESLHPVDRLENGMFFLAKPFDPEELAHIVREALDA